MAGLLGVCTVVVVVFCLARSVLPSLRPPDHRLALDAWHVAMGVAMAAMLLTPLSRPVSVVALAVAAVGLGASSFQAVAHRAGRAAYVRLGVGCAAMAAMLVPAASASAAPAAAGHAGHTGHAGHLGGVPGPGADAAAAAGSTTAVPPTVLVAGLVVLVAVVLVARLAGALRASDGRNARLDACCDVAMALAMGYMLLLMI